MWNKTSHDFGDQPEGQFLETSFEYIGDKKIRTIVPSCDCTMHTLIDASKFHRGSEIKANAFWENTTPVVMSSSHRITGDGMLLIVLWKTKVKRRERDISTDLTIEYTDGSIDILELKAHVIINNT